MRNRYSIEADDLQIYQQAGRLSEETCQNLLPRNTFHDQTQAEKLDQRKVFTDRLKQLFSQRSYRSAP